MISIHVPREGDDSRRRRFLSSQNHFYPRPPRGGRQFSFAASMSAAIFLSTSPARGTTHWDAGLSVQSGNFYPRPPRGGRPRRSTASTDFCKFLSTSPARGTTLRASSFTAPPQFLSTSPARGTTKDSLACLGAIEISIHVPREGDDTRSWHTSARSGHFYPRPPRGGRHYTIPLPPVTKKFLSTSPARGTTPRRKPGFHRPRISIHVPREGDDAHCCDKCGKLIISIHVPREGDDLVAAVALQILVISIHVPREGDDARAKCCGSFRRIFLSTSPARGTTFFLCCVDIISYISIHVPREGDDLEVELFAGGAVNFYPRPPRGGRLVVPHAGRQNCIISIHVPREGDDQQPHVGGDQGDISIHVPREGDDTARGRRHSAARQFLSTSPARGTTRRHAAARACGRYFYPRPPRGGRPGAVYDQYVQGTISIHVPREGDDVRKFIMDAEAQIFLSTSPARGTTRRLPEKTPTVVISIHVPREGDDRRQLCHTSSPLKISIHVPREGDDCSRTPTPKSSKLFLSTSPARGTTAHMVL